MSDLWSDEIMLRPTFKVLKSAPSIVPRERVNPVPKPTKPSITVRLADQRERERQEAISAAWAEGFRAAERKYALAPPLAGEDSEPIRPTLRQIAMEVAHKHNYRLDDLLSARRHYRLNYARQEAFWRCRQETLHSLPEIGRFFHRDHTSVLHGIRRHEERMAAASAKGEGT